MILRKTAAGLLLLIAFFSADYQIISAENNNIINSFDFEGNSFQGWTAFGSGIVSPSDENAFSGEYSLKISNRTDAWNGPSYNILSDEALTAGQKYNLSVQVFNASDSEDAFSATIKTVNSEGTEDYVFVGSSSCNPGQWTELSGNFTFAGDLSTALLYIESKSSGDFYIDNAVIKQTGTESIPDNENTQDDSPVAAEQVIISDDEGVDIDNEDIAENEDIAANTAEDSMEEYSDSYSLKEVLSHTSNISRSKPKYSFTFETDDRFTDNFYALYGGRLIRNKDRACKGTYSLYTSERESDDSGPALSLDFLKRNTDYAVSVDVLYEGAEYKGTNEFCLCIGFFKGDVLKKQVINTKSAKKGEWTKLNGTFSIPSDGSNPFIYVITNKANNSSDSYEPVSFYIDDFTLNNISASYTKSFVIILVIVVVTVGSGLIIYFTKIRKKVLSPDKQTILEDIDPETQVRTRAAYNRDVILMIGNPKKTVGKYIAVFDIDSFKSIEKLYGKQKSDQALKRCSEILINAAGSEGTIYRTGNNEFVCISEKDLEIQFSRAISIECSKYLGYPFSIAQGYDKYNAEKDGQEPDIRDIINRADEKMCINKEKQKNSHSSLE